MRDRGNVRIVESPNGVVGWVRFAKEAGDWLLIARGRSRCGRTRERMKQEIAAIIQEDFSELLDDMTNDSRFYEIYERDERIRLQEESKEGTASGQGNDQEQRGQTDSSEGQEDGRAHEVEDLEEEEGELEEEEEEGEEMGQGEGGEPRQEDPGGGSDREPGAGTGSVGGAREKEGMDEGGDGKDRGKEDPQKKSDARDTVSSESDDGGNGENEGKGMEGLRELGKWARNRRRNSGRLSGVLWGLESMQGAGEVLHMEIGIRGGGGTQQEQKGEEGESSDEELYEGAQGEDSEDRKSVV